MAEATRRTRTVRIHARGFGVRNTRTLMGGPRKIPGSLSPAAKDSSLRAAFECEATHRFVRWGQDDFDRKSAAGEDAAITRCRTCRRVADALGARPLAREGAREIELSVRAGGDRHVDRAGRAIELQPRAALRDVHRHVIAAPDAGRDWRGRLRRTGAAASTSVVRR